MLLRLAHNARFTIFRDKAGRPDRRGFTLLELIASLVLLGLLTAIFGMGLVAALKSNAFSRSNVHLSQKAQLAMMRISRELLELTQIEAVSAAGNDPFIIYQRVDPLGNQAYERYGLHYDAGTHNLLLYTALSPSINLLDATTTASGDVLINGVQSFSLNYFQGSNTWVWGNQPELLSSITVNLQLIRPEDPSRSQSFNTTIHLRNTGNYGGAAPTNRPQSRDDYNCFITTMVLNP